MRRPRAPTCPNLLCPYGKVAYVCHVVNLEHQVKKMYDNLPPRPMEIHILLIIRPTREEWGIKSRMAPFVVNRDRLIAAFERLTISHSEYMGGNASALKTSISTISRRTVATLMST